MNEVIEELRQQIITRQLEFDTARKLSGTSASSRHEGERFF
jgi:hypothetical protein